MDKAWDRSKSTLLLFIILFISLNFRALTSYFSQDDFFHLNEISEKRYLDIPTFFIFRQTSFGFYRPLSRETFNLLMLKTFGLNPLPFHLVNLGLILSISFLVFLISKRIFNSQLISVLSTII